MTHTIGALLTHTRWMGQNAYDVANVNTPNHIATRDVPTGSDTLSSVPTGRPTDLTDKLVEQIVISDGFEAQAPVVRTEDEMLGTLLDLKG